MFITSILIAGGSWTWIFRLGGPGLIVVGLIDNSIIPIPGGMDLFTILLTAHHRGWWVYYGAMATLGAVIGGYVTYRLARKGGKASLEKKIGRRRAEGVYKKFEKGGFTTVFLGSVIPPPFPLVPVLMAAGIMQFEPRKFLTALTLGRGIRFFALAFLGRLYGTTIVHWQNRYYQAVSVCPDQPGNSGRRGYSGLFQVVSPAASARWAPVLVVRFAGRAAASTLVICKPAAHPG
jgi:membrane protein YqaA with SNARE-associated domain